MLGKYLASLLILIITIALTLYYVLLLYYFGNPDSGPLLTAYLGLVLYGAASLAIGLLASSLTSNQIVAAVIGMGILLPLSFTDVLGTRLTGVAAKIVHGMSMGDHFADFSRGLLDLSDIVYFISIAAVFLFLTVRALETRRWR